MFRLVVKAINVRQAAMALEAHGMVDMVVRMVQHETFTDEWLVDLAGQPGDTSLRFRLNAWYCERINRLDRWYAEHPSEHTPHFPDGSLLFWTEVPSTLISVQEQARTLTDEALSIGMRYA